MNISHVARVRLLYKTLLRLHRGMDNMNKFSNDLDKHFALISFILTI